MKMLGKGVTAGRLKDLLPTAPEQFVGEEMDFCKGWGGGVGG
jgi:hypothetical protein